MTGYYVVIEKNGLGKYTAWLKKEDRIQSGGIERRSLQRARKDGQQLLARARKVELSLQYGVVEQFQ